MNRKIDYRIDISKYRVREYKDGKERHIGYFSTLTEAKRAAAGHHWLKGIKPDPTSYFGFIYEVEDNLTGMKYIGKKQYHFYNKKGETSNDIEEGWNPDAWDESDWKYYKTSSEILKPIIEERYEDFTFTILEQAHSKLELHLLEVTYQKEFDVLNATLSNGERKYYNQNIASCEFNIHKSGEVVRSIRYNPLYKAWLMMIKDGPTFSDWKDPRTFIKEMKRKAKGMACPMVVRTNDDPYSIFNTIVINKGNNYSSTKYKGVAFVDGKWMGCIKDGDKEYTVEGLTERQVVAELDDLIDREGLNIEKQIEWI